MIMLFVVACLSDDPQSCKRIDFPQTFETKQECNAHFVPGMLAFAQTYPQWRILFIGCGPEEASL
jgi:hypothetical protein